MICIKNHKIYIGQTIKKLSKRMCAHFSFADSGKSSRHLYCAIRKHGKGNFVYWVIDEANSKKELDDKETYWVRVYKSHDRKIGYNMNEGGACTKKREEVSLKIRYSKLGRKASKETREKISKESNSNYDSRVSMDDILELKVNKKMTYLEIKNYYRAKGINITGGLIRNRINWIKERLKGVKTNFYKKGKDNPYFRMDIPNDFIIKLRLNGLSLSDIKRRLFLEKGIKATTLTIKKRIDNSGIDFSHISFPERKIYIPVSMEILKPLREAGYTREEIVKILKEKHNIYISVDGLKKRISELKCFVNPPPYTNIDADLIHTLRNVKKLSFRNVRDTLKSDYGIIISINGINRNLRKSGLFQYEKPIVTL